MAVSSAPGEQLTDRNPAVGPGGDAVVLPCGLLVERERTPWSDVSDRARQRLVRAVPALAGEIAAYPVAVFGLTSGFFYLPAALARQWGCDDDSVLAELSTVLAVGHCHFAFQDQIIDEGMASPVLCLLAHTALLSYLDGLSNLCPARVAAYRALHDASYDVYCRAILRDIAHRERLVPYHIEDLAGLGDKSAPAVVAIHLAADLAGCPERADGASAALLRLCTGLQHVDDLNDAALDAGTGNHTWPVTAARLAYPDVDPYDAAGIRAAVVGSGVAAGCLRLARSAFADAARLAISVEAEIIVQLAQAWIRHVDVRQRLLSVVRGEHA